MATTVAQIAAQALNAAAGAITDAAHAATLTYETRGAYSAADGDYSTTETSLTGRAVVDTSRPVADVFPDYVAGPGDQLVMLEGFSAAPAEGWALTYAGQSREVRRVQDIAAAGTLFYVVAR